VQNECFRVRAWERQGERDRWRERERVGLCAGGRHDTWLWGCVCNRTHAEYGESVCVWARVFRYQHSHNYSSHWQPHISPLPLTRGTVGGVAEEAGIAVGVEVEVAWRVELPPAALPSADRFSARLLLERLIGVQEADAAAVRFFASGRVWPGGWKSRPWAGPLFVGVEHHSLPYSWPVGNRVHMHSTVSSILQICHSHTRNYPNTCVRSYIAHAYVLVCTYLYMLLTASMCVASTHVACGYLLPMQNDNLITLTIFANVSGMTLTTFAHVSGMCLKCMEVPSWLCSL